MLRITADMVTGKQIMLRLDGQVTGRWVKLLRSTCDAPLQTGVSLVLDLRNVSFADLEGIVLLRDLTDQGVELLNALPFIAEQIRKAMPR
jgi:ABC-type transporter Mla MlaB component